MSDRNIPEFIDAFRYAEQNISIRGILKISSMDRLQSMILPSDEKVNIELEFGIDEQKLVYLKGHLDTNLNLQCQRCMQPYVLPITSDFCLGIVKTLEEANDLPDHYEPALVNADNQLALRDLVEDELILNLPIIPKHEQPECSVDIPTQDAGWEEKGQKPFEVLASLRKKDN